MTVAEKEEQGTIIFGRHVGGLQFAVTLEEQHEDSVTITEHPVEQGAAINDHAYVNPATLTVRAGVSDTAGEGVSREMYENLLELMKAREPFQIVTGKRLYKNMLIEGLSATTDATTENALIVTIDCREVIIVETTVVSVPPRKRHKNAGRTGGTADKGAKQAKQSDPSMIFAASGRKAGTGYRRPGA